MQFFSASQQSRPLAKPPVAALPVEAQDLEMKPETCGWYDSSFDLASGLEISEQADDMLYQLCELFMH
ncbi:hypothetical protein [Roseateles sp. P5_E7]